jgi:hypothetical protein
MASFAYAVRASYSWTGGNAVTLLRPILLFLLVATLALTASFSSSQTPPTSKKPAANAPPTVAVPNAPQSTHYPILLLAFGSSPGWDVRIGPKGPELLERQGYPPIVLEPAEISREGTSEAWIYRAKDTATGADVSVHLSREACSEATSALNSTSAANAAPTTNSKAAAGSAVATTAAVTTKYTFRAVATHAQIGTLQGCARIAAELFPRMPNQSAQDDDDADKKDADKKKVPAIPPITNSKAPVAVAFLNAAGKIVVSRNGIKKIAGAAGTGLSLAHDGKRLLYTRPDPKPSSLATVVLYDFESGRSRDLVHGGVGPAFWSADDARVAYLNVVDQKSQVWVLVPDAPEKVTAFSPQNVTGLQGWSDARTVLATDAQNAYWLSEDKPAQTVALREIYGDSFQIKPTDTLRVNPVNPDLLLVAAAYVTAPTSGPAAAPVDATGTTYGFFLYELRAKRRVTLSPADEFARDGEWSRDGLQVYYTRRISAAASAIFRIFWDGTGIRRYSEGSELAIGQ